ncbi:MAG: hypothetical protein WBA93_37015 [Microcoleaceae cyanobacterium]
MLWKFINSNSTYIALNKLLQLSQKTNQQISVQKQADFKQKLLSQQNQLNHYLEQGIKVSQQKLKTSSKEQFQKINQRLLAYQENSNFLNSELATIIQGWESNQYPTEPRINKISNENKSLENQGIILI